MASKDGPSRSGSNVIENPDPFEPSGNEDGGDEGNEDGLRIAGVRSNNPFAAAESGANESIPAGNEESVERVASEPESVPTRAVSPGAGEGTWQTTDPSIKPSVKATRRLEAVLRLTRIYRN